jgi:hypothetical protein
MKWPRRGLPGPPSWAIWRRFLKTYTRDSSSDGLRQILGSWTQPNLRNWPAYYDPSSHMLRLYVSPSAAAATDTTASWLYRPTHITHTRRFLAVSKSNTLADARPEVDAVPVTALLQTPKLLGCSLPPIPNAPALDTVHTTTSTTLKTMLRRGNRISSFTLEKPFTTPLHQVLTQKHTTLLAFSDGGCRCTYHL